MVLIYNVIITHQFATVEEIENHKHVIVILEHMMIFHLFYANVMNKILYFRM